jgi:hypothetical protein
MLNTKPYQAQRDLVEAADQPARGRERRLELVPQLAGGVGPP